MKLLTVLYQGKEQPGVLALDGASFHLFSAANVNAASLMQLIQCGSPEDMEALRKLAVSDTPGIPLTDAKLLAPIPKPSQDIICLGINYMEHAAESARFNKEAFDGRRDEAVYFSKRVHRAVADQEPVPSHSDITHQLDYEAELAVIIGKDARGVSADQAKDYVFGYTIVNDVSAREVQTAHQQWYFGKSLDGTTPMGPYIVTADEFSFPPKLSITSRINGETRQNSNTNNQIFKIDYVIQELSHGMTLEAGTVIATGTPSGVGMGMTPPCFLKTGDVMECEIQGIGILTNPIGE